MTVVQHATAWSLAGSTDSSCCESNQQTQFLHVNACSRVGAYAVFVGAFCLLLQGQKVGSNKHSDG